MADTILEADVHLAPEGVFGLHGPGKLRLGADVLEVSAAGGVTSMSLAAIDGAVARGASLEIHAHGRHLHFAGAAALEHFAEELHARARSLGGVTRALRWLGSARGAPGPEHDRFFQPLLHARRRAERAADDPVRLAAFDGDSIARAFRTTIAELARAHRPGMPSARRALEHELTEILDPVFHACENVTMAAESVASASEEAELARWREWVVAIGVLFATADARWPAFRDALGRPAPRRRSLFRRLVRLVRGP